jgi:putative ABC transport system permease protein
MLTDLEEEIRAHLAMEEQENLESGLAPEEAHHRAMRRFGNATLTRERSRDMWTWNGFDTLWQDVRYGARQLRTNRGFTAVAVLTLALGIGANTAIFSVINSVLLRPLPFKEPGRLAELVETEEAPGTYPLSGADYLDWQAQNRTFEATSLYSWKSSMSASGASEPEPAEVVNTQANFFDVLGVSPMAGRRFVRSEDTAAKNRVVIASYGFWQRHFGGDGGAIGKTVELNDEPYTVVGIMPAWFNFPEQADLWTPMDMDSKEVTMRGAHNWNAVGRIKTGVSMAQAGQDLLAISKRLEKQYPNSNNKVHSVVIPLRDRLIGDSREPLLILLGAVGLLLLIACANVANLLLARATARQREMALRASLGAGRFRLVRQLLTESILLALTGAGLGILAAWGCVRLMASAKTLPIPRANPVEVDGWVLLCTIGVSVLAGVLFGLAPALQISGSRNFNDELKAASQAVLSPSAMRRRVRDALVVGEIALTLALLVGAGLLIRSFAELRNAEIGVNPHNLVTMAIDLPKTKYANIASRREFFDQLIDRVNEIPGVAAAAVSTQIPPVGGSNGYVAVDGKTDSAFATQLVWWNTITPDYFRTLGIPLLAGRNLGPEDLTRAGVVAQRLYDLFTAAKNGPPKVPPDLTLVALISQAMARTFWPNQDPVGRSFHWSGVKVTVIGLVGDVKDRGIRSRAMPQAYFPLPLWFANGGYGQLTVKTRISPKAVLSAIREKLHALDSGLAVFEARTMDEVIAGDMQDASIQTCLLGSFAMLALVLASVGLYGVMSYLVSQRTREIGIRMAVGAKQSDVLRLILRQGATLSFIGVAIGVMAAIGLMQLLSGLLYGVAPTDPLTFVSVTVLLALVALAAYCIPARRATKIDPMLALRYE